MPILFCVMGIQPRRLGLIPMVTVAARPLITRVLKAILWWWVTLIPMMAIGSRP